MKCFQTFRAIVGLFLAVFLFPSTKTLAQPEVGISPSGHYFTYRGKTKMILADSGTQVVMQNRAVDYRAWVDRLALEGYHSAHIWSFIAPRQNLDGSRTESRYGYVYPGITPWARKTSGATTHDGGFQWDLFTFDEGTNPDVNYWPRLRDLCQRLASREMMLGITVFFAWPKDVPSDLNYHPFYTLNGGPAQNRQDITFIHSPGAEVHTEAWSDSWPVRKKTQWLWEKFSLKLISEADQCGNVWFDFRDEWSYDNGTNTESHFRDFFMSRGQIWADRSTSASFRVTNPSVPSFGASPSMQTEGGPSDHLGVRDHAWGRAFSGIHYLLHNDSRTPGIMAWDSTTAGIKGTDPLTDDGRRWVGYASRFFNEHLANLDLMLPSNSLVDTGRGLAAVGKEYAVYLAGGGSVRVDLSGASNTTLNVSWYDATSGQTTAAGAVNGGGSAPFTAPSTAPWVLHLLDASTGPQPIECTEQALLDAISTANSSGGDTITFNCQNTTILMTQSLGVLQDNITIDGESKNITLEYTRDFTGCAVGDNGIGGPAIAQIAGQNNIIRGLTFKHFLESIQLNGPNNTIENNTFLAHNCSDDGLSSNSTNAVNNMIRNNHFQDYNDKAIQMSFGGGRIVNNTFLDSQQPVRSPYNNSLGETIYITDNQMLTTGDRSQCTGVTIDGTYSIRFEGNTLKCLRGLRIGGQTEIIINNNTIEGNDRVGIRIFSDAKASISNNRVTNNALAAGVTPAGGVVVADRAQVDLGGGSLVIDGQIVSSPGNNVIQGNGVADVRNLRSGYLLKAENNCWDNQNLTDVQNLDTEGNVDVDPLSCTSSGTTPPTVSMTSPTAGSPVSDTVTVSASASDDVGIQSVRFQVDGTSIATDTTSPYSTSWDTTTIANGSHSLDAVATDTSGNTTTSTSVTVTVNNILPPDPTPPAVSITSPIAGSTVSDTVTVLVSASDNVGIQSVLFQVDGTSIATDTTPPYSTSWDTTTIANGSHSLNAVATFTSGNISGAATVTVNVNNTSSVQATHYLDVNHVNASDTNLGTDPSQPWKTLNPANASLQAGDTVEVAAGTYNTGIDPANSGTSSANRITYYCPSQNCIIQPSGGNSADTRGDSWIKVDGFTLQQGQVNGWNDSSTGNWYTNVKIIDSTFRGAGGTDNTLENFEIRNKTKPHTTTMLGLGGSFQRELRTIIRNGKVLGGRNTVSFSNFQDLLIDGVMIGGGLNHLITITGSNLGAENFTMQNSIVIASVFYGEQSIFNPNEPVRNMTLLNNAFINGLALPSPNHPNAIEGIVTIKNNVLYKSRFSSTLFRLTANSHPINCPSPGPGEICWDVDYNAYFLGSDAGTFSAPWATTGKSYWPDRDRDGILDCGTGNDFCDWQTDTGFDVNSMVWENSDAVYSTLNGQISGQEKSYGAQLWGTSAPTWGAHVASIVDSDSFTTSGNWTRGINVGDIVEYNWDGVARQVTGLSGDQIDLSSAPAGGMAVDDWFLSWGLLDPDRDGIPNIPIGSPITSAHRTYTPVTGSPVIDAGDNANCGHAIVGSGCDIGPAEAAGVPPSPDAPAPPTGLRGTP